MSASANGNRSQITDLRREPEIPRRGAKKARVHAAVSVTEKHKIRRVVKALRAEGRPETDESSLLFTNSVQDVLAYYDHRWPRGQKRQEAIS